MGKIIVIFNYLPLQVVLIGVIVYGFLTDERNQLPQLSQGPRLFPCRFDETDAFLKFKRSKRISWFVTFQNKPSSSPISGQAIAAYFLDY